MHSHDRRANLPTCAPTRAAPKLSPELKDDARLRYEAWWSGSGTFVNIGAVDNYSGTLTQTKGPARAT
jgi:hypothetical protein